MHVQAAQGAQLTQTGTRDAVPRDSCPGRAPGRPSSHVHAGNVRNYVKNPTGNEADTFFCTATVLNNTHLLGCFPLANTFGYILKKISFMER